MTNDPIPTTTATSAPSDPVFSTHSLADFAQATADAPRPASMSLDVARHHAFTGEITFHVEPLVRVYLDGGVVYHAEITGGPSISQLLLNAAVADSGQLDRGVVRVGDVEHLGRLFDRDDSIDRDAVMVVVEQHTDQLVNQLAEQIVCAITISPYRHHATGIHRWFVAPTDAMETARPVSDVAQIDRSVVDDLPSLGGSDAELRIEWNEPDLVTPAAPDASHDVMSDNVDLQAELDRFDADEADWAGDAAPTVDVVPGDPSAPSDVVDGADVVEAPDPDPLGAFHIVWPDGSEDEDLIRPGAPTVDIDLVSTPRPDAPIMAAEPHALGLTPAVVSELPEPDGAIPDDVAAAVKRALQAIDEASAQPIAIPEMELSPISLPQITEPTAPPAEALQPEPSVEAQVPTTAPAPVGFAPPTADMRAEIVYQRQAAELASPSAATEAADGAADAAIVQVADDTPMPTLPERAPAAPQDSSASTERRGALRRLISSLRGGDDD